MLEALGKPSSNVPFIMPKRVAETDPTKQITEYIGSGPYVFVKDEFKPGDKAVYVKFDKYKPRKEKPSGTAGGKHVYVDKVVWNLALRDYQAQVNALANGEVDIIENVPFQHYETLLKNKDVEIRKTKIGLQYMCRFNHLHKPFDNVKVRQAVLASFRQQPFLQAQVGVKELYKPCASMFTCGTPYGVSTGSEIQSKGSMKKAQQLLKESGYDGTPVVIMKPTDLSSIDKLPEVAAQLMRQAGFKVDLQAMDWQTLVSRRAKKDPVDKGGWNMFCTAWVSPDIGNPINNAALRRARRRRRPGSAGRRTPSSRSCARPSCARPTRRRRSRSPARCRSAPSRSARTRRVGEYVQPQAGRKAIKGWITSGLAHIYWNIKK